jgi:thiol-disulfide isomerase/thioredoxin
MNIVRLSPGALHKILSGHVKEPTTCVVKFYANECPYCHNLRDYYQEIADDEKYSDLLFFAFNVGDYPQIEGQLNFNGVPTISLIKAGGVSPKVKICPEPEKPNDHTWYTATDIKTFIEKEK